MPYKLEVDLAAVNAGLDYALLVGKGDIFPRDKEGHKTSDERTGVKLTLALQGSRLSTLTVKFDHDPLPKITDDEIMATVMNCKSLLVRIPDAIVSLFSSSNGGGIGMTATAETAQIVTLNDK